MILCISALQFIFDGLRRRKGEVEYHCCDYYRNAPESHESVTAQAEK